MITNANEELDIKEPRILHEGVYRLYQKPDGTLRIQFKRNNATDEEFFEIPGGFFKIAGQMKSGKLSMGGAMGQLTKLMMNKR